MEGGSGRAIRAFLIGDIRGYTAFTAEHGDEAGTRLARRFATIAAEAVEAWSGRLVELRGDEVLCAFDDPAAALRASVELQDALADEVLADPTLPLRAGLGLATGDAVPVGTGFRGSALNLAARLCGVSAAGEVQASVDLIERVGPLEGLVYEVVEDLDLKGFGAGQRAYQVRPSASGARHGRPGAPTVSESPTSMPTGLDTDRVLVGREAEMRWLGWHWRRARHGHERTVLLLGAPGVGLTRLAAELASIAAREGAEVRYVSDLKAARSATDGPADSDGRPRLTIFDDTAADAWTKPHSYDVTADGRQSLTVVLRRDEGGTERVDERIADDLHLLLRPLDLAGIRALATAVAPDAADELPVARILHSSGGFPGPARDAVKEWADRIEAERAGGGAAGSLPAERSSFVGRGEELRAAQTLLASSRLLTLTGPPGTGKTRLAIRLAQSVSDAFPGGTVFVPLASIRDERLVASAIARALQLRVGPEASAIDVIAAYLSERDALLVLDNFEHLLAAAADVGALLGDAPRLKVVVTSRSPLDLAGEQVYLVPPLGVPSPSATDVESVAASDASALFVLRARGADPEFDLRHDNAELVARIAARLEGLPLAIELAAARVRSLGCRELLEHLDRRLPILTGGSVDAAERHRTMRDAIAWSYELMSDDEQAALRHLSVFRGGFTLRAASRVADRSETEIVDVVDALVVQSLIYRADDRVATRYGVLELIREFAAEGLLRRGEEAAAITRHTAVFMELVHELEPALDGEDAKQAAERLAPEIDNLRAALEHAIADVDAEAAMGLAASSWRFWQSIGQLAEGHAWLERVLSLSGGTTAARASATAALGGLAYWQGDFDVARESYRRAHDLFTAAGDHSAECDAVYSLSLVATLEGDLDAAERYADEAMELARALGVEAKVGEVLMAQTTIAWKRGELYRAAGLNAAALEISQRLGMRSLAASQLVGVAGIAFLQGDETTALRRAGEAIELAIETGNTHTQIFALDALASFAVGATPTRATRLCGATSTLRAEHGGGWTLEAFGVECAKSAAASRLDPAAIEEAWVAGTDLDLDAATELARSILRESAVGSGLQRRSRPDG